MSFAKVARKRRSRANTLIPTSRASTAVVRAATCSLLRNQSSTQDLVGRRLRTQPSLKMSAHVQTMRMECVVPRFFVKTAEAISATSSRTDQRTAVVCGTVLIPSRSISSQEILNRSKRDRKAPPVGDRGCVFVAVCERLAVLVIDEDQIRESFVDDSLRRSEVEIQQHYCFCIDLGISIVQQIGQ